MKIALLAAAIALAGPTALAHSSPPGANRAPAAPAPGIPRDVVQFGVPAGPVYRVAITVAAPEALAWTEWIAPKSGHCRSEAPGRAKIVGGRSYAVIDDFTTHVRTGSKAFLGYLTDVCASLTLLREPTGDAALDLVWRGVPLVAKVEERLSASEAVAERLFTVAVTDIDTYDVERVARAAAPRGKSVYWLGPAVAGRRAIHAVEHFDRTGGATGTSPSSVTTVFYELPSAGGRTSAFLGAGVPRGELQVRSQLKTEATAKQRLAALQTQLATRTARHLQPIEIKLANGERASMIRDASADEPTFYVVTKKTLVSVTGFGRGARIVTLAGRLRPAAAR